jgi:CRISPR-associated protein Cmr1
LATQKLEITLKTLTPLWTGGVDGTMDRIHETGIIGSLRWWYEAIVRGLGGWACDPTSDRVSDRCPHNEVEYCDVCQLFGATGQRREFRLVIENGNRLFNKDRVQIPSGRIHPGHRPRLGGWFIMGDSMMSDNILLQAIPLIPTSQLSVLSVILTLIDRHAAVGAKISNGYGIIHLSQSGQPLKVKLEQLGILSSKTAPPRNVTLPDIRDFFFAKFQFEIPSTRNWWQQIKGIDYAWNGSVPKWTGRPLPNVQTELQQLVDHGCIPLAPAVRDWLRFYWFPTLFKSGHSPKPLENHLFGVTGRENVASKIVTAQAGKAV